MISILLSGCKIIALKINIFKTSFWLFSQFLIGKLCVKNNWIILMHNFKDINTLVFMNMLIFINIFNIKMIYFKFHSCLCSNLFRVILSHCFLSFGKDWILQDKSNDQFMIEKMQLIWPLLQLCWQTSVPCLQSATCGSMWCRSPPQTVPDVDTSIKPPHLGPAIRRTKLFFESLKLTSRVEFRSQRRNWGSSKHGSARCLQAGRYLRLCLCTHGD